MKYCPVCFAEYSDEQTTCAIDKSSLRVVAGWKSGDMIRKYRIIEKLGEGGMGSVYKAEHVTFEELRALKVMHPSIAADPKFVRRFLREAKAARRLRHPNTVVVEDVDQADDGSLFIAMEFIDGPPLSVALRAAGRFRVPRALSITRSLASALQAAHAEGIIHRDIKPPNILMARDKHGNDLPKLVDFGIVALQDASTTLTSQLLLTPTYAAPEQFQMSSDEIDGRADLYSLGFVLYEMLTGRLPFSATNATQWMLAKITQPIPSPNTFVPELARIPGLDQCILKLTATNRDDRHKDAAELIEAIDAIRIPLDDEPPTVAVRKPAAPAPEPPAVARSTVSTEPPSEAPLPPETPKPDSPPAQPLLRPPTSVVASPPPVTAPVSATEPSERPLLVEDPSPLPRLPSTGTPQTGGQLTGRDPELPPSSGGLVAVIQSSTRRRLGKKIAGGAVLGVAALVVLYWTLSQSRYALAIIGESYDFALPEQKRAVGKTPRILVENLRGNARITGGDTEELKVVGLTAVRAFQQADAERTYKEAPLEMVTQGNLLTIRTNQDRPSGPQRITTDLEITVPKGTIVQARGRYGDFDIVDVAGVDVDSDNASVRANNIGGDVRVDLRKSDIIRAMNVTGNVDLKGGGWDVELDNVAGQATVNGSYSGELIFRNLAKPLRFESRQTEMRLEKIPGELRVGRGYLSGHGIEGPMVLKSGSKDIDLSDFTQSLNVSLERGDVALRPGRLPLSNMEIRCKSGNIHLAVPAAAMFQIRANTNYGEIDNAFGSPLTVASEGRGARLTGAAGGGGPEIELVAERGSVIVRKETGQ